MSFFNVRDAATVHLSWGIYPRNLQKEELFQSQVTANTHLQLLWKAAAEQHQVADHYLLVSQCIHSVPPAQESCTASTTSRVASLKCNQPFGPCSMESVGNNLCFLNSSSPCNQQKKHCRCFQLPAVSAGTAESATIMKHKGKELTWLINEQEIPPPELTCLPLSRKSCAWKCLISSC